MGIDIDTAIKTWLVNGYSIVSNIVKNDVRVLMVLLSPVVVYVLTVRHYENRGMDIDTTKKISRLLIGQNFS